MRNFLSNDGSLAHYDQEESPLLLELICSLDTSHYGGPICFQDYAKLRIDPLKS